MIYSAQLMIVGSDESGKHILASRLQGKEVVHSVRVYTNEWAYHPRMKQGEAHFQIWVFSSLEDYILCYS